MTKYNKFSFEIDTKEIEEEIEQKRIQYEKLVHETGKWMRETEDSWLDKQLSLFFSDDFDLFWAYDCAKRDKDWKSIQNMLEDHDLRITKQSGSMVPDGSYITNLFCGMKLLGTLEIKFPRDGKNFVVIIK